MRRSEFEIKDGKIIEDILNTTEHGTFALCKENKPYSVPVNIVYDGKFIYFHGAKKGRKKEYLETNSLASLSIFQPYSLIQSYFSTKDDIACPATQFFKSIICDGKIFIVDDYAEKVKALGLIMKKFQPEGRYIPLDNEVYKKMINATEVFRFEINDISGKLKLGQNLSLEKFNMILDHLEKRGNDIDKLTIQMMRNIY